MCWQKMPLRARWFGDPSFYGPTIGMSRTTPILTAQKWHFMNNAHFDGTKKWHFTNNVDLLWPNNWHVMQIRLFYMILYIIVYLFYIVLYYVLYYVLYMLGLI